MIVIKNIAPTDIITLIKIVMFFEILNKKSLTLLLDNGSITALANFKDIENKAILITGNKIIFKKYITITYPSEFFINTSDAETRSYPSDKYPPTIGT